jgi:hypothetical protein
MARGRLVRRRLLSTLDPSSTRGYPRSNQCRALARMRRPASGLMSMQKTHLAPLSCSFVRRGQGKRVLGTAIAINKRQPMSEGVQERFLKCGSRLWQQAPWEDTSAGEWQRRGTMWRSSRAAPIAMLFAGPSSHW